MKLTANERKLLEKIEIQVEEYASLQQSWSLPDLLSRPAYWFGLHFLKYGLMTAYLVGLILALFWWPQIIYIVKMMVLL